MLDISISLVIYNPNHDDLKKLFHSISLQKDITFEILVYDNSPLKSDLSYSPLAINYEKGFANLGYGTAHNKNFSRSANSKYFLVINPDIYFDDPYLLKKIIDRMNNSPEIGLSSIRLLNPDGTTQDMHRLLPNLRDIAKRFIYQKLKIYDPKKHKYTLSHVDKTRDFICPSIGGSFMVFKTDTYKELNGFDEEIFLYFEDIDISRRAHFITGETNTVFGEFTAFHAWGRAGYKNFEIFKVHILSTAYYFQKFGIFGDNFTERTNKKLI